MPITGNLFDLIFFTILKFLKVQCPKRKTSCFWTVRILKILRASGLWCCNIRKLLKANMGKKVLFSRTDFLPWEILLIKKLDFIETKPTLYSTFKTEITKVGLVFSISNFFTNKISQGRKSAHGLAAAIYLYHICLEISGKISKRLRPGFQTQ
jgi:hypothetical protein